MPLPLLELLSEECEVYTAVCSVFQEVRMVCEVICFTMLQYEYATGFQHVACQHDVWYLCQIWQCIRGVGKDKVELFIAAG